MLRHPQHSEIARDPVPIAEFPAQDDTEPVSARLVEVALRFGIPLAGVLMPKAGPPALPLRPGTITLVSGPSGTGKTRLLSAIARRSAHARFVHHVPFPGDVAVVDAIAPARPIAEALALLTSCGLGEPMLWIRRFDELSTGEQFRAVLARAISAARRPGGPAVLLCDEFGTALHRRLAQALAFNIRKLATRERLCLVVATSRDHLERDLAPDTTVRLGGETPIIEHAGKASAPAAASVASRLRIHQGTLSDYDRFAAMHYRQRCRVGFIDRVYVCREGLDGEPLGVIIYGHPALELRLRNEVTRGRYSHHADRLNREVRVLKRLVIHPDLRGCGIGHWLIRRTLPLAGTRFVECLAAMGQVNPVFDKAGMQRIGVCNPPAIRDESLALLRDAGVDPLGSDFVSQVCSRPMIRRVVAGTVYQWYRSTRGRSAEKIARQSPSDLARTYRQLAGSEPVYYLWSGESSGRALIDAYLRNRTSTGCDIEGEGGEARVAGDTGEHDAA
jgi:ABC-type iron transport system FetAB ATPase subunit/GNAT superfamily N-acetyltransferase